MALEGTLLQESPIVEFTALAALASGQVVQVPDGRAGVCPAAYALGQPACAQVAGTFALAKTASIVLLAGQKVFWTKSTGKATYDSDSDFYVGVCAKDAAAAATTVEVHLNQESCAPIQLGKTEFIAENTLGLTPARVVGLSKAIDLAFDAVAEVAETAIYSKRTIPLATGMRAFFEMSLEDEGNDAALDWVVGLASADAIAAADFDAVAEAFIVKGDGNALDLQAESDDGTNETAATDTTVNLVASTKVHVALDLFTVATGAIYVNGVQVLAATTFCLDDGTGPLLFIAHMEKTSNDTTAKLRIHDAYVVTPALG